MKRTHDDMVADDSNVVNSGEEDSAEDGTDKVAPYDAKQEKLPASPVFTPEFEQLNDSIQKLLKLLSEPLTESSYRNPVICGLLEEIKIRTKGDFPEHVRIALIGSMKSGTYVIRHALDKKLTKRR